MSEYSVIQDISNTLLNLLRNNIGGLVSPDHITLDSPADIKEDTSPWLSLYLYQIVENHHLKNQTMKYRDAGKLQSPPSSVSLLSPYSLWTVP